MWCASARKVSTFDQTHHWSLDDHTSFVNLKYNFEPTFQLPIRSVRSFATIRQLRTIRRSLTLDALRDAAYALTLSPLDYCNSLYMNASMCELHRLQLLINTAVRVVSGRSRFDHITDFVKDVLQWLPITQGYI